MRNFKNEVTQLFENFTKLNRKVVAIFLSVAILQTISWYFTSKRFFSLNFCNYFLEDPNAQLYGFLFWFLGDCITLLLIPLIIIKYGFREKISSFGVTFGDYRKGVPVTLVFSIPMVVLIWFVSGLPDFSVYYPTLHSAKENWNVFFIFEFGLLIYMFAWEFFWRGFMLFGLESEFGYYSIFIQMIPFVILHNGKPVLETFGAIAGGIILGVLALRTRSYIYGVIIHFIIIFSLDLFTTIRYKSTDISDNLSLLFNRMF